MCSFRRQAETERSVPLLTRGARREALPLDSATFEKVDETFGAPMEAQLPWGKEEAGSECAVFAARRKRNAASRF